MNGSELVRVLRAVPWLENIDEFGRLADFKVRSCRCLVRVAIWAKQLETADAGNPALSFVRELQIHGQYVATLLGVALYKPAAAGMRAMLDTALYYSFFRSHPIELATLVRTNSYYEDKGSILEFHRVHTPGFNDREKKLGLVSRLQASFAKVSAIVHGQIPGEWIAHHGLRNIAHDPPTLEVAIKTLEELTGVVSDLLLVTVAQELWSGFAKEARKKLTHGLAGDVKAVLGLTVA